MNRFRFGVFAQLITSFVLAVLFTVTAAIIGIVSIRQFHDGIEEVALSRLPAMTLAYQLGQQSEAIVASAPMLVRAKTQAQRETISFRIADRVRWLREIVDALKDYDVDRDILESIEDTHQQLLDNFDNIDDLMRERIENLSAKSFQTRQLHNFYNRLDGRNMSLEPYAAALVGRIIEQVMLFETEDDPERLKNYEKRILEDFKLLETRQSVEKGGPEIIFFKGLSQVAMGTNGLLKLNERQRQIEQRIAGILALNERLSSRFVYSVNDLIRRMRENVEDNSQGFQKLVESRTNLLTILVLSSMFVLVVIGVFVLRRILTRLNELKYSMRIHAEGGVARINLDGDDEIADMGYALRYLVNEINKREVEILRNEERFRDIAEATSDWFFETDQDLCLSLVSERFFEITGFESSEFLGMVKLGSLNLGPEIVGYDNEEDWIRYKTDLKNHRRFRDFVYSLKCPDGKWRQIKLSGKPAFDENGTFIGYRGTGSDISAETQARSRLMAANEIMPGAFALWDHDNRLVMCNRKYYQFYKIINDRIRPGVVFDELVTLLEERKGVRDNVGYANRRLSFRKNPIGVFMEPLSSGRYLQVNEATTMDGGVVSLVIDITDRIEAEDRLEQARQDSENANKAKSKFLAAASHDLRQPLHAIGMFLSALEERRSRVENEDAQGDLHIIRNITDSLDALRGLLNALLDISKLDAGVMKADKTSFMLRPLGERLIKQFQARADEKGLRLKFFCPDVAVYSDPVLLERVLSNLISNAVRYTQTGGVMLGVRRRGNKLLLQIIDTGSGIPKDKVSDIFVEFQQLDNPARDRRRGLGLGLAIVERVLALLDHPLNLRSHVGRGSCFSVEVPSGQRCDVSVKVDEERSEILLGDGDVPLIVVVDDEPDILEAMAQLISGWEYEVIAASSTNQALKAIKVSQKVPTLILADYRLQEDLSGADCIKMIQEQVGSAVPAAIITGDTAPDRIQEAKASGFVLLHKPLRPAKLRQLIRNVQVKAF